MAGPHLTSSPDGNRNSAGRALFSDIVVNGRRISKSEIAAEAQHHSAPSGKPGMAWNEAARALVVRELLLDEADRQGIRAKPRDFGAGRIETETEAMIGRCWSSESARRTPQNRISGQNTTQIRNVSNRLLCMKLPTS